MQTEADKRFNRRLHLLKPQETKTITTQQKKVTTECYIFPCSRRLQITENESSWILPFKLNPRWRLHWHCHGILPVAISCSSGQTSRQRSCGEYYFLPYNFKKGRGSLKNRGLKSKVMNPPGARHGAKIRLRTRHESIQSLKPFMHQMVHNLTCQGLLSDMDLEVGASVCHTSCHIRSKSETELRRKE